MNSRFKQKEPLFPYSVISKFDMPDIPKVVPLSEKVTMARGTTFPCKEILKNHGFQWYPEIKDQEPMWICDPAMSEGEIHNLDRKIMRADVEIRNVRRVFLFGE